MFIKKNSTIISYLMDSVVRNQAASSESLYCPSWRGLRSLIAAQLAGRLLRKVQHDFTRLFA